MVKGVERLMPWRTLVEVCRFAPEEHEVAICSAQTPEEPRTYEGVTIYSIGYGVENLRRFVEEGGWEVMYYPITYRQGLVNMQPLTEIKARKIGYVPGGLCPLEGSMALIRMGEAKRALPYLLDTVTPHSRIAKKLQKVGFEAIVCQAPLTARDAEKSGWKKAILALPGFDKAGNSGSRDIEISGAQESETVSEDMLAKLGVKGQRFVLFSGAPAPTRGAVLTMKAFDKIAERVADTKMVMLMRRDVSSDFTEFDKAVEGIVHKDRFVISYERLNQGQLFGFFREAWAVMLPFLIVPSEIPLTYFEVMQWGVPVITFENGGTTDYLREGLKISRRRTVGSFGKAIEEICTNESERKRLAEEAKRIMYNHPSWEETSKKWLNALS